MKAKTNLVALLGIIATLGLSSCGTVAKPSEGNNTNTTNSSTVTSEVGSNDTSKSSETGSTSASTPSTSNGYTVKWVVEGKVVETDNDVKAGITPSYDGTTPTKAEDKSYTYTFKSWDKEIAPVTGDVTYTAVFNKTIKKFTVKWVIGDTVIETDTNVEAGTIPSYDGNTPTKNEDKSYTYTFKGWDKEVKAIYADTTYTAVFNKTIKKFTVKWMVDGKAIETDNNVEAGTTPSYDGDTPTKAKTAQYTYTFDKWDKTIEPIYGDVTYNAVFTKTVNQYTLTFDSNGGSKVSSMTKDYGTIIQEQPACTLEGHRFTGWTKNVAGGEQVTFPLTVTENLKLVANWNKKSDIVANLKTLLQGDKFNPIAQIPEAMRNDFADNLIKDQNALPSDYTNFVDMSKVTYQGYGEQWNMIYDNLKQTELIFDALRIVDSISTTSIEVFQNYFDKNPADSATHTSKVGDYDVTIQYKDDILYYALDLTILGKVSELWINYNTKTGERAGRLQIGENQALKYVSTENSYKFALKVAKVRASYFEMNVADDGTVTGLINEHTYAGEKVDVKSAAQFTINTDGTAFAIGNKCEAMPGTKPYVVEQYDTATGRLVNFEVKETTKLKTFHTMWFDLSMLTGITSLKFVKNPDAKDIIRPILPYINNNTTVDFQTSSMYALSSRDYDIELRDRFYTYKTVDTDGKAKYETIKVQVPMLFIQEDKIVKDGALLDIAKEINKRNKDLILNSTFTATEEDVIATTTIYNDAKIEKEFDTNKEMITTDEIINFIGNKFLVK